MPNDTVHTRARLLQSDEMNTFIAKSLAVLAIAGLPVMSPAVDRIRPGQWTGTTVVDGKTYPTTNCMTQKDADALNGDAAAVTAYLKTIIPPEACKITDVRADGNQVIYTATCGARPAKVVTTTYHGTTLEGTDSSGAKITAKLVGACK